MKSLEDIAKEQKEELLKFILKLTDDDFSAPFQIAEKCETLKYGAYLLSLNEQNIEDLKNGKILACDDTDEYVIFIKLKKLSTP